MEPFELQPFDWKPLDRGHSGIVPVDCGHSSVVPFEVEN